ncbi:maltose ABC transporter permease MalF [Paracoccus yeei]|uniref:maltose ABC transporter permease MalF n=1 Tax=Paracoccus yeei TaxID=147645 RepID=UPI00242AF8A1|nr:maltose ABC transporter permease MalF [Paracoccus yeei]
MSATHDLPKPRPLPRLLVVGLVSAALLWGAFSLYSMGQPLFGAILLGLATCFAVVFGSERFYGSRFIFPGIAAVLIFIAFPVIYTIWIGFTNFSSFNLLTYERTIEVLTSRGTVDQATEQPFAVAPDGDAYRIWLPDSGLLSDPVSLMAEETAALSPAAAPATLLERREAIKLREGLGLLTLETPDGQMIRNTGLRSFASVVPEYVRTDTDQLTRKDGTVLTANHEKGFFETAAGEQVPPGWRVNIGFDNFKRIFASEGIRGPTLSILVWTFAFAGLSVLACFSVGLLLAVILQWEHLRFKSVYRVLLILPYAVPSFISILVFKGLFNQSFGEINLILEALFGIRPSWFTDATLARTMVVIVNTWLGYPYMMLLAMGFLQAVPQDHKKAAALEGASALRVFFTITLPQIIPPFLPLLIAAFAFNFNNLVLIFLLTRGLPDIPGTVIPAGQTDILASFTYRLAFDNAGQQFGLAGAITLIIFLVVAVISYANFVAMRRAAQRRSGRPV